MAGSSLWSPGRSRPRAAASRGLHADPRGGAQKAPAPAAEVWGVPQPGPGPSGPPAVARSWPISETGAARAAGVWAVALFVVGLALPRVAEPPAERRGSPLATFPGPFEAPPRKPSNRQTVFHDPGHPHMTSPAVLGPTGRRTASETRHRTPHRPGGRVPSRGCVVPCPSLPPPPPPPKCPSGPSRRAHGPIALPRGRVAGAHAPSPKFVILTETIRPLPLYMRIDCQPARTSQRPPVVPAPARRLPNSSVVPRSACLSRFQGSPVRSPGMAPRLYRICDKRPGVP